LGILENVEQVIASSNTKEKAAKEKATRKHDKGKHKGTNSHNYRVSKKAKVEKSCVLCQKYRSTHTTHNTGECRKYDKDGTLQKSFSRKAAVGQKCHSSGKKETSNSFAQIMERFSSLEKMVKKTQKSARKKKHCQTVTLLIPTRNRIVGKVVLENLVAIKNLNKKYVLLPPVRSKLL
jgi:hypothetical protein